MAKTEIHDYDSALADYSQALKITPKNERSGMVPGLLLKTSKEISMRRSPTGQKVIQLTPAKGLPFNGRGWTEFQKGDFDAAIVADATHAIELSPTNGSAYGTRGWARYGKGDMPQVHWVADQ